MNLNLYGHDRAWLIVDCGLTFDAPLDRDLDDEDFVQRHELVCADPRFIVERRDQLAGIVITHAHEDHVGAVAYLWERLRVPVWTTRFTAEVLRRKLAERGLADAVPVHFVDAGEAFSIGPFNCEFVRLTHSLPEPNGLIITTAAGRVFHTGDWKLDAQPVLGQGVQVERLRQLGREGVDAMVCDSTNALKPGHSISEGDCEAGLLKAVTDAEYRVVVTCFGSNIARLITLARVAKKTGRYIGLFGRSLHNMYAAAQRTGYWPDDCLVIDERHLGFLPRHEVLAVSTGSQGEYRAALARMAHNAHPHLELVKGDTVVFSSIRIPGNEDKIDRLMNALRDKHIRIVESADSELPIHASGHPNADELKQMYEWIRPRIAVPTHGEPEHMEAHARIAKAAGVERTLTGLNGDLFQLAETAMMRRGFAIHGRIAIDSR